MSARSHWLLKGASSLALVPLSVWLLYAFAATPMTTAAAFTTWLHEPGVAGGLAAFFVVALYHSWLGLESIIDDYIASATTNRLARILCGVALLSILVLVACSIATILSA